MKYATGGIVYGPLSFYYPPSEPTHSIGDGVRILSHPDAESLASCPDPVGTIVDFVRMDTDQGYWGPYKVDIRWLGTWFYCKATELEELTSSERLFYGV